MSIKCLISIIIPIRNLEQSIEQCINSIQIQSYNYFEIVAVENGSSDLSWHILQKLSSKDNRIKLHQLSNCKGVAEARNFGLQKATGDYICFVDGDDLLFPEFLSSLLTPFSNNNIDFTMCDMTFDGKTIANRTFPKDNLDFSLKSDFKLGLRLAAGSACAKLFKRPFIGNTSFSIVPIGEDSIFMLQLYVKKPSMIHVPYIGYHYVQHPSSSIHDLTREKIDSNFEFLHLGKTVLQNSGSWEIGKAYWRSRAKSNSIERFLQIQNQDLKHYWKKQFILFLKTDFFDSGVLKNIVIFLFQIVPLTLLQELFVFRSFLLNIARYLVNIKSCFSNFLLNRPN